MPKPMSRIALGHILQIFQYLQQIGMAIVLPARMEQRNLAGWVVQ
jgi:hypothetical protein